MEVKIHRGYFQVSHNLSLKSSYWQVLDLKTENRSIWSNLPFCGVVTQTWGDFLTQASDVINIFFKVQWKLIFYFYSNLIHKTTFHSLVLVKAHWVKVEAVKCQNYLSTCPSIHPYLRATIISGCIFSIFTFNSSLQLISVFIFFAALVA